ncbi:pentatricopeptide repeat-containing protein At3g49730-like [Wolffia australiana]
MRDLLRRAPSRYFSGRSQPPDEFAADVERIYRILRKFHTRPAKLELALAESGARLRPGLLDRVLRRCGDAGALAFRFYTWAARQPGAEPPTDARKSLLRVLAKTRQFGPAWALLDDLRRHHPSVISPDMFVILMRRFAKARMVAKAVDLLDEMPRFGCPPDAHAFTCLLDALSKTGAVKDAAALFQSMKARFPPDLKQYTCLLHGWCRAGRLEEARELLADMRRAGLAPDRVVYNVLLAGHAAAGRIEDARQLLREMETREGCEPNAVSYTALMQGLCGLGRVEEAARVMAEMRRRGCAADAVAYAALIGGFCKAGNPGKALELLGSMGGVAPDRACYLPILAALEKEERLEESLELVRAGPPDPACFAAVIRLACKLGDMDRAKELWQEVEDDPAGPGPGSDEFLAMVHGFLTQDALGEACGYFKEMVSRGLFRAPQYGTLKELLNKLVRAGKVEPAKELWADLARGGCELNVAAWTIWVQALFAGGHVKEACAQCLDMMEAGLMPQPDTFARLMKGLKKLYNRQIAAEITDKVRAMAAERNVTFKAYKRRGVRDLKEKAKALADGGRERRGRRRRWGPASK